MQPTPEIKGWCPGAYAPMASNDGLLIRAKIVGSRIGAAQLAAVAAISADYGNGLVDLSQRAQLQIRGVSEATLPGALRRLDAAYLLPRDAAAERVTNIIAAPLSDDANAMAHELADAIQADQALRALPAKFLFAIDGGALPLSNVEADIRLSAVQLNNVAISVAGADDLAIIVDRTEAVATALKLARAFVALRNGAFELRRMGRLVKAFGATRLFSEAGLVAARSRRPESAPRPFLGAQEAGGLCFAGVAAPSGRWRASALEELASLAASQAGDELRLTPWRAILIPAPSADAARSIVAAARALDLIVSHEDPRLAVVACPGAPECPQARGDTRGALARLAPLAQKLAGKDGVGLHISGCAKGCARPGNAPVTLIADDGRFNLVDTGGASDAPQSKGLDIDAVESALAARAREHLCQTH
ncbi:precorrin-3B synthase [Methylocystis sp. Sn-Cys]|uniref:precorrin-3B synthase n=1 Tax=Methylocystis sp. Sn-Cys TaxID=1701263 RepID=UPI00192391F5|nr:precorrin-3B synthase [Methylocystis sp. Sn-Cys]MBL1258116.1 precorrin-3B synthase [Methylocystis sp. Sn-Cys]